MHRRTAFLALVGIAATSVLLAGCTPGSTTTTSTSSAASKNLGTAHVTLKLMSTPESGAATKATIAAFEKKYPNITVKYTQTNYSDYNKSLNLDLQSNEAPDIALLNSVGNTVKDKLVLNLDSYAKLYGWTTSFPSNELSQWRVATDGTTLGSGSLYATPAGFSVVGLYYNKDTATKLGITKAPTTVSELEADMALAKKAGDLPLQVGNAAGHASFIVQSLAQASEGAKTANAWAFGHTGSTFVNAANKKAATTLLAWQEAGYMATPATVNGTDLQGAVSNFVSGKGLFFVDGNWDAATIAKGLGTSAGFAAFPGENATGIGTSVAYGIAAKSAHPNQAAAFLNFLQSKEAGKQQFAQGFLPDNTAAATPTAGTLQADIVDAWSDVSKADGLVAFNNNATATMNDTLTSSTQELIGGKSSVTDFLSSIQTDWAQTHK